MNRKQRRELRKDKNLIIELFTIIKNDKINFVMRTLMGAFSFITKLLRHLLPFNFKSIKYFGFYNKNDKIDDSINKIVKKEKIPFRKSLLKWCNSITTSFNRIPIICPKCGHLMDLVYEVS